MISRASMKQQMKGNRMKKKPVIKKNIGKMLETFSPAYSVMKGKGPISGALAALGKTGMSPIGSLALDKREEAKKRQMAMAAGRNAGNPGNNRMTPMEKMMAGGPVKRKRSIDGCAMKERRGLYNDGSNMPYLQNSIKGYKRRSS